MNTQSIINQAIAIFKGKPVEEGKVIAHESDPISYEFNRYEGETAVCYALDGSERRFPAAEIFDVNKVRMAAIEINAFGNYVGEDDGKGHGRMLIQV